MSKSQNEVFQNVGGYRNTYQPRLFEGSARGVCLGSYQEHPTVLVSMESIVGEDIYLNNFFNYAVFSEINLMQMEVDLFFKEPERSVVPNSVLDELSKVDILEVMGRRYYGVILEEFKIRYENYLGKDYTHDSIIHMKFSFKWFKEVKNIKDS